MTRVHTRRLARAAGITVALLLLTAGPAAADPPGPTNYDARVTGLEPAVDGVEAAVIGGDSFLQLSVDGHEVVVPGYDGQELFLRFDPTGEVYENRRSVTYFQNQDRYDPTAAERPAEVGADVAPEWVLVSTDGTYAWHDHRIHWMVPTTLPPRADGDGDPVDPALGEPQLTTTWAEPIPIRVDGQDVGIVGDLYWLPSASPVPTAVAVVLVLAGAVALGWRSPTTGILAGVAGAGAVALAASVSLVVGLPAGVEAQPLQPALPVIAVLVALAGWAARARSPWAIAVAGAGGVPLAGWALTNLGGATAAVVPPAAVPDLVTRLALGAALGGAVAGLVLAVRHVLASDALSLDRDLATNEPTGD